MSLQVEFWSSTRHVGRALERAVYNTCIDSCGRGVCSPVFTLWRNLYRDQSLLEEAIKHAINYKAFTEIQKLKLPCVQR